MSGPKRNPDKLNTIGVVVVGICGAVLVYVTIVALQAFYMNNTSEIQTMADYGGQDMTAKGRKADEMRNISEAGKRSRHSREIVGCSLSLQDLPQHRGSSLLLPFV